ncbi:PKD domain-containing protein [Flavobacterium sp. T12S277]|uniref:PKD domain-containing protein n=1 Tax=Flavobacterium sp. T12S277 TaxID=3402752 RepID=UPI003AEB6C54
MKLNYSDRLHKGLNNTLLFFLFVLPVYTFSQNCTVNANADRTICPGGATALPPDQFYLLGTANTAQGTNFLENPVWSQIAGPAVQIVDPNLQQTLVRGAVPGNTYTFRLTAKCEDGSTIFDDIVMVISPITLANAGADQTYCQGTYPLNANAIGPTETGTWSVEGNNNAGVTVNNPNSPNSTITVSGNSSGSTTLRWTITNGSCTSTDDVIISSLGGRMPVTAGTDMTLSHCYSSTQTVNLNGSFGGNTPGQQQGTWTVVSGPSIPTFSNANRNNTAVSGLLEGTYVFRWTVAGTCANGVDEVTVIVPPPTADVTNVTGSTAYFCDGRTSTILQGTIPLYVNESVQWTQTGGPTATIQNPTSPSTLVSGMTALGTYTFSYTLTNSVTNCVRTANYVVVLEDIISISGGPNQTLGCNESEAVIPVTFTGNGQMSWQLVSGPNINPVLNPPYPSYPTAPVNFSGNSVTIGQLTFSGTYVLRLIKAPNPGSQCETVYNTVVIVVSAQPTTSSAGTMQIVPCNSTSATLAGNLVIYGKGTWSQISGPSIVTFTDVNSPTTGVSPLVNGGYMFRWTISGGSGCDVTQSTSEVLVSSAAPTPANAGNDQAVCFDSTVKLQGNATQSSENGTWTVSPSAGIVFSDPGDPNSTVTGLAANTTYTFTWTIVNGCGTSADTVDVVTNNTEGADANAGADQCLPTGTTTITLSGNAPTPGTGLWTQTAGTTATITNPTLYNTTVTGLSDGDYTFKWTVSNVGCADGEDTVGITIAPAITVAQAGATQNLCSNSTTVTGNAPAPGESGLWELVSGGDGPVIANPTNPTTTITGLTPGSWVYKWTISRGFCASTSDTVQLNIDEAPSPAIGGPDQTVCNQSQVTLGATAPLTGNGIWSLISGPNSPVFSDARSATSTLSGLITGEYILEWATYTGVNCPTNRDQVTIKVTEVAAVGPDFATCLEGPLFLVGNVASTGTWSYVSGGTGAPTITTTSNNSAAVTNLVPSVYVFRYTIAAQGFCPETSDDIQVTVNGQIVTAPNAGPDQEFCDAGVNQIQLAASALDPGTTGKWTKLFGPAGGSFVDDTNPNTIFTNPGYGFYVFNWTVSSGTCSESDQIRIENSEPPSQALAGGDQVICGSVTDLTAIPPLAGVGNWTQVSGPTTAVFSSEISATTSVSNLTQTGGIYVFRWTITNGALCPSTTDTVQITVTADLTIPNAGPDQTICVSDSATLAANAITSGTGQWSRVSGPAGSFSDTASPASLFTPSAQGTYVLRWTATNLSCVLFDEMTLVVNPLPSTSNAGTPINICEFQTLTLAANTPAIGTGLWTQVSGPTTVAFTAATSPTTTVLGTQPGVYVFAWTISNGLCAPSSSNVTVTVNALPPLADAGPDQTICNTGTVTLNGNNPVTGIGTWTFVTNPGATALITNPNAFNTTVTNISVGTTRLKWTISNGSCNSYADEVNIVRPSDLTLSALTSDTTICQGGTTTLTITPTGSVAPYTYQWQTSANGVTGWTNVSGQTAATFTTNSALANGEYYYRVNVSSTCTQVTSNVAKLTIIPDPLVTLQPTGSTICSGETHTMTVAATTTNTAAGTIAYQWQSSVNGTSGWTNVSGGSGANTTTYITAALSSSLYFRAQITQSGSGCETFSNSALVNVARITTQPVTPAAVCVGGIVSINIAATLDGGTGTLTYQWQSNSGAGFVNETNPTATTASFTSDILNTTTQFRCLITSSTTNCVLTSNTVTATVVPDPAISVQPTGGIVCTGGSFTLSVTGTGGTPALNYQWYSSSDNLSFTLLSGATSSTYTTPALTQDTYYRVDVSATGSGCGLVSSNSVLVDVIPDPVVNVQPVGNTICSGATHTMTVVASGDPLGGALVYQWQRSVNGTTGWVNTTGGSGATTASYTTGALTSTFYYRVRVRQAANGCEVFSDAVPVFVATITTQPATPADICVGGIVNINIAASLNGGAGTLSYQWQSNTGSGFVNETTATATTPNFTSGALNATTQFRCLVTSSTTNCILTSNSVTATVVPDPSITVQPAGTTICSGGNHTLSVTAANGTPALTYQWFSSTNNATFTAIGGATSATYTTPALTQTTYYKVEVSASGNGCNTITSNVATVTVLSAISIVTQPVAKTNICSGSNATLNVVAAGGSGNYSYQWKSSVVLAGPYTNIAGATSASYTTPNLTQTTFYQVAVSDPTQGCTTVLSGIAAVIIPSIETQPVNPTTVCVGGTVAISTAASANNGSASFTYQWQRSADGVTGWADITGEIRATNPHYLSGPLSATTYYRCVITSSSPSCTLITNVVVATVIPDPTITVQPVGGNICEGGVFTMTSGAQNGSGNFTYQWQRSLDGATGWANVTDGSGANTTTYTTGFVNADAFYRLRVTDSGIGCGVINSNPAKVDVFEIPIITTQPKDGEACINQAHTFNVVATGNIPASPVLYQWQTASVLAGPYTDVTSGTGGTTALYTTPTYATAGNRYFRVIISQGESGCRTISNQVTLEVFDIPAAPTGSVIQQPSCANATGTVSIVNPDLGTGYEYSSDGTTFQASNVFAGLASGTVTIYVRRVGLNTCISSGTTFTIFNRICAVPETFTAINGDTGGSTAPHSILDSDTLNGVILNPSAVNVTINSISSYLIYDFNPLSRTISVAPGTPPGDYTLTYTICEIVNPGNPSDPANFVNCSTTTETISVTTAGIDARIDIVKYLVNGYTGANNVINALTNDTVGGAQATLSNVTLSVVNPALPIDPLVTTVPYLDITTGNVNVPPGTVKGLYEIVYKICEIGAPLNCDTSSILVPVGNAVIVANDDRVENINGHLGLMNAANALTNDTLNGVPITGANFNEITITQNVFATPLYPGANVPVFSTATGSISIPPGTPANTYFMTYTICEKLNPTNCADGSIAVVVNAAPIIVNDDRIDNINGYDGGVDVINVYTNAAGADTFDGQVININLANVLTPSIVTPAQPKAPGAPVPVLDISSGFVTVPPGTPAGQYQIKYQICEDLNPGNCDDAIVIITVIAPVIEANDDTVLNVNGYEGAAGVINIYDNDLLNGGMLDLPDITTTVISTPAPINGGPVPTLDSVTGLVDVPAGTPAGEYKFVYKICENLNPTNCDQAVVTIVVAPAVIDAVNDANFAPINGFVGSPNALNALDNDTLNGLAVNPSEVVITNIIPATPINGGLVPVLNGTTGIVSVPPGTAAGMYFIGYQLNEKLNLSNTDSAIITVEVSAPLIVANDDTIANVNGYVNTTNAIDVLLNDTLNGVIANISKVTITVDVAAIPINGGPIPVLEPLTGFVSIPAGTPAGDYEIQYHICEKINPLNCDNAKVFITVTGAQIDAVNDAVANINGFTGATNAVNALTNDTLNGMTVIPSQVTISNVVPATPINGGAIPVLNPSNGNVDVPPGTAAGTYTIGYRLSENLNTANFDTATITIVVIAPTIIANADSTGNINGFTGANNAINAITNDRLNGLDIQLTAIDITSISTTTPAAYISGNPVPVLDTVTGNVNVPAGTAAGTYVIHYRICEKLNPLNCSEADITINVTAPIIDANTDFAGNINGYTGANNVVNALTNDTVNGLAAQAAQLNISVLSTTPPATSTNGIVPILNTVTGSVDVPPGTSAGTYFIQYQICEKINPGNCSQATIIIVVNAPVIVAEDDTITNINGQSGINNALNAFTNNDTYNGVLLTDVSLIIPTILSPATSINGGLVPVLDLATGNVNVPAGTPAGAYQIKYRICDKLNPTNCDDAVINIVVIVSTIVANDDAIDNINGDTGATNVLNAYANDTLNGTTILQTNINSTLISGANSINGAAVPVLNVLTGAVDVPPGTAAGIYSIVYKICDKLNPSNCDEAVIRITVALPSIRLLKQGVFADSNGDGYAQPGELIRYSFVVTNTGTLDLTNVIVTDPKATVTGTAIAVLGVGQSDTTTFKGTYVLTQADINRGYVENQALVTAQPVSGAAIQDLSDSNDLTLIGPNDPTITPVPQHRELTLIKGGVLTGNGGVGSVIKYSFTVKNTGNVVVTNLVISDPMLTATSIAVTPNVLAPGQTGIATASYTVTTTDVANGEVVNSALVIGDDPQGNPVIDISDSDDPALTGDDDPTVVDLDLKPSIALIKTATFNDENKNGFAEIGETITYHFSVTNTGNILLVNVVVKDPKPGITITGGPIILKHGETNSDSFVGTYVLTAADIEAGSVENQAEVNAVSPDGKTATDLSDGNSILGDDPTVLPLNSCKIVVHNAFSPNGDGINEVFKIDGVECYPDVFVEIYDRWGVLVYDAHGYNNTSVAFKGISEGRATLNKQKGLPVGTYFYVITYKTYLNEPISLMGYLYFSK